MDKNHRNKKRWIYFLIGGLTAIYLLAYILIINPVLVFSRLTTGFSPPSVDQLEKHVKTLTSVTPFRNHENIESLNFTAKYVELEFAKHCDSVSRQEFDVNTETYQNVRCIFSGSSRKRVVVGAHYDVEGEQAGADDNASGVAGILELARMLKAEKPPLPYDLELVAYSLEEPPHFRTENMGSYVHAKSLQDENIEVKYMISVEMIGYFNDDFLSQKYPISFLYLFFPFRANFITLVGGITEYMPMRQLKAAFKRASDLPLYSLNAPASVRGIDFSDHMNYWKFNYPGFMLTNTSFYRNPHYHKETDTIETIDFLRIPPAAG